MKFSGFSDKFCKYLSLMFSLFSFSPDDKDILLACGKSDEVLVIDAEKLEVTKHIPHKEIPWGVVAYPKAMGTLDSVK